MKTIYKYAVFPGQWSETMPKGAKFLSAWRPHDHGVWHCYVRSVDRGVWVSLCGAHIIVRSGGQGCRRPEAVKRCSACDVREMQRRGWNESGPPSTMSCTAPARR